MSPKKKQKKDENILEFDPKQADNQETAVENSDLDEEKDGDTNGSEIETETKSPESDLEKAQRESREYLDSLQRLKAEFDNFRKRMAKERQRSAEMHQSIVIEAVLPTLDNFDAAFQKTESASGDSVYEGLKMIHDGLVNALEKLQLKRLDVVGKPFDPEIAEALMTQPTADSEPDTIIGEISAGYQFKDRILRPARVVVASALPDSDKGDTE